MPYCINNYKKTYKGNEPSPKGFGYCAHSEEIGTIKNGLDGNKWIISATSKGVKRWTKYKTNSNIKQCKIYTEKESLQGKWWDNSDTCDCSKFVSYKKNKSKDIHGLEFEKGKLYKFISYNNFSKKSINIDEDTWIKYELPSDVIQNKFCGTKKKLTKDNPIYKNINHIGYTKYFTYDEECGFVFLVYVKNAKDPVYIYRIPSKFNEKYFSENDLYGKNKYEIEWAYIQLVAKIIPEKIFIGKNPLLKEIKNSIIDNKYYFIGNRKYIYGNEYDGNSILLKLKKNKYIFISDYIYSFTSECEITEFISSVCLTNSYSYPYAKDINNNYYLFNSFGDYKFLSVDHKINDPYDYYENLKISDRNKYPSIKDFESLYDEICN